jgi:hypothetical protein
VLFQHTFLYQINIVLMICTFLFKTPLDTLRVAIWPIRAIICTRSHNRSLIHRRVSSSVVRHCEEYLAKLKTLVLKNETCRYSSMAKKVFGTRFSPSPFRVYLFYICLRTIEYVKNTVFSLFVAWGCWCRNFLSLLIYSVEMWCLSDAGSVFIHQGGGAIQRGAHKY